MIENNRKEKSRKKRKIKIDMSVELDVLIEDGKNEKDQLESVAKIYQSCFGDKDVKIENIRFLD